MPRFRANAEGGKQCSCEGPFAQRSRQARPAGPPTLSSEELKEPYRRFAIRRLPFRIFECEDSLSHFGTDDLLSIAVKCGQRHFNRPGRILKHFGTPRIQGRRSHRFALGRQKARCGYEYVPFHQSAGSTAQARLWHCPDVIQPLQLGANRYYAGNVAYPNLSARNI